MVNSESMDSPGDGKAKDCITQLNSLSSDSHSPSPVTASSLCLREMDFANETADISTTECGSPMDSPPETAVTGEEESSRLTTETENVEFSGLYCSVPLNKVQDVLNSYTIHLNNQTLESNSSTNSSGGEETRNKKLSSKLLCLYCDRTFVTTNLRQKHVDRCHSVKQARRYSSRFQQTQSTTACIFCSKLNNTDHSLKELFIHLVDEHSNKYFACVDCEERFPFKSHLEEHDLKIHNINQLDASDDNAKDCDLPEETRPRLNGAIFTHDLILNAGGESNENQKTKIIKTKHKTKIKNEITTNSTNKIIINSSNRPNLRMSVRKELRKKKVGVKSTKVGVKRNTRLQAKITQTKPMKKRTKTGNKIADKNMTSKISEINEKSTGCINPYPTFDAFFRVKKITDHSIDNLKISSLTFDDVFDKAFYNRIKCNIQENLQNHIDGKLFKNEESENRISNFEKMREVNSSPAENFGCELTLNAATPVVSLLSTQFGEDLESQIEYGSKASKKKPSPKKDEVHYKYFTRRKYQASILESKENRDLSKLDMWTQLLVKNRQQKIINDKKTEKERLEYIKGDEYRTKMKNEELNRILDRRGPFEDLKEEANKKAAMEKLHRLGGGVNCEAITDVTYILNDVIDSVIAKDNQKVIAEKIEEELNSVVEDVNALKVDCNRDCEIPYYLKLRQSSSLIGEPDVDRSDRITLICSSQETENFEECNVPRDKNVLVELSGEWTRSRIYICAACGVKVSNVKMLIEHKSIFHQNVWVQHYEFVGNQSELYRHLSIPGLGKVGYVEDFPMSKSWRRSDARFCTKCSKTCNSLAELHRHVLECGEDWSWMLARKKLKYRPFGAKSRRKRRGLVKRILHSKEKQSEEVREKKKYNIKRIDGPRPKPSDADTIQRMLANLPAKRASRKIISLKDGFPKPMKRKRPAGKNLKQDQSKSKKIIGKTKKALQSMKNTREIAKNCNQVILRKSVRNINKVFSSKLLDTNSTLIVKRKIKTALQNHRITRSKRELFKHQDEKGNVQLTKPKTGSRNSPNKNKKIPEVQETVATTKSPTLRKTRSAQNLIKADIVDDKTKPEIENTNGIESKGKVEGAIATKLIRSFNLKKLKKSKRDDAKLKTHNTPSHPGCENGTGKIKIKNGKRKSSLGSLKKAIKKIKLREKNITNIVQIDGSSQINDEILPFLESIHLSDDRDDSSPKTDEVITSHKLAEDTNQNIKENSSDATPINQTETISEIKEQAVEVTLGGITIKTEEITHTNGANVTNINDNNKTSDAIIKPKIRKRVKGLNDCIAMLTSKLQQKVGEKLSASNGEICNITDLMGQQKTTELSSHHSLPIHFRPPTPPHSPNLPRPPTPPRSPVPPSSSLLISPRPSTLPLAPSLLPNIPPSYPPPPPPVFSFPPPSFPTSPLNLFSTKNHIQQVKFSENQNGLCENNFGSPQNEIKSCSILSGYTFGENLTPSFYENVSSFRNISKLSGLIATETPTLKDDDSKKVDREKEDDDKLANFLDDIHRDTSKFKEVDVNIEIDLIKCLEKVGENNGSRAQDEKPLKKKKIGKFNNKRKENINVITRDNFVEAEIVTNHVLNESENNLSIINSDEITVINNGIDSKITTLKPKKKICRKKSVSAVDETKGLFKADLVLKINRLTTIEQVIQVDDLKIKKTTANTSEKHQKKRGRKKKTVENIYQYDVKAQLVEEQEPELMENKSLDQLSEKNPDLEKDAVNDADTQTTDKEDTTKHEEVSKKVETDSEDEVPLSLLIKSTTSTTVISSDENVLETPRKVTEIEAEKVVEIPQNQNCTDLIEQNNLLLTKVKSSEPQIKENNKKRVKSTERKRKPKTTKKPEQKDVYDFDIEDEDRIARKLKISTAIFQTKNKGMLFPTREASIGTEEEEEESGKNRDTEEQPQQVEVLEAIKIEPEANDEDIPDVSCCCEEINQKFAPETEETLEMKVRPDIITEENCVGNIETEGTPEAFEIETRNPSEDIPLPPADTEEIITETLELNIIMSNENHEEGTYVEPVEFQEMLQEIEQTSETNTTEQIKEGQEESVPAHLEEDEMTIKALEMKIRKSIMLSNEKLRLEAEQDLIRDNSSSISEELQIIKDIIAEAEQDLIQQANNNDLNTTEDRKLVKKNKKCKKKIQDKNKKTKKKSLNPTITKTTPFSLTNEITSEIMPIEDMLLDVEDVDFVSKFEEKKEEEIHNENGKAVPDDDDILNAQLFLENNDDVLLVDDNKELENEVLQVQEINEKQQNDKDDILETDVEQQKLDDVIEDTFSSLNIEEELCELENKENLHSVNKGIKDVWDDKLLLNFGPDFEEYEIQELSPDVKASSKKEEKHNELRPELKLTIDISEINHPIVLSPDLKTKKDIPQIALLEQNEQPPEIITTTQNDDDRNVPSDIDASISCSQQNDGSLSDVSCKIIDVTKDTSNSSFHNAVNVLSKKAKRGRKTKTMKLTIENSNSFNSESQIDSFLQTPDLNDSAIAAKIKAQFKVKVGNKKANRNRKTSMEKLYCDICDKMFVRCDNLVKHRRTLTHIAKLSELEAKEAAEKAKANAIEDNSYKMNINISDILNKTDKEPEPDLNGEMTNKIHVNSPFMLNTNSDTLKLADIINDVLNKPVGNGDIKNYSDPTVPVSINAISKEPKRYKSLGERKSFESDINSAYSFNNLHMTEDMQLPKLSTNADSILKHPISISILENIIENQGPFDYIDDITVSSNKSAEEQLSRNSPSELSVMSDSKQYDSNQITFTHGTNIINSLMKPDALHEDNFVKPTQYEEISNDSSSVRNHFEDPRQRKALNRDEELFLECCSLLKSSSEVSSYSKRSSKNVSMINNFDMKPIDEPDWLERKSFSDKNQEFRTDSFSHSCPNTPLGDGFGDEYSNTNSNTIASDWNSKQKEQQQQTIAVENPVFEDISLDNSKDMPANNNQNRESQVEYNGNHFRIFASEIYTPEEVQTAENSCSEVVGEEEEIRDVDDDLKKKMVSRFGGLMAKAFKNSLQAVKKSKQLKKKQLTENNQTSITDYVVPLTSNKAESDPNDNKKMLTKGAMKVFEGLRVSIPTDDLDIKELLNGTLGPKKSFDETEESSKQLEAETGPTKAMKISMKFGNKLGLKVTKKKHAPKPRKASTDSKCKKLDDDEASKKTHDVYDFEETQDNTEIFSKSNFTNLTAFRNQIIEKKSATSKTDQEEIVIESDSESNNRLLDSFGFEAQSVSSYSTESSMSVKKPKQKNITKKKCMIMGRIFKNAFKSKIEDDIRDIPIVDNSKLVEDYVLQLPENDKDDTIGKMTEHEMDMLFDKLLHDQNQAGSKKVDEDKPCLDVKQKSATTKPKPKPVAKRKRQRLNSDSTDDEFNIGKPRKRNTKKKQKNVDDTINLEQELKECIGVASRKSQRKCTSGKQNVLVEFWSSDDSNFESLIYNNEPVITNQVQELVDVPIVVQEIENSTNIESDQIVTETLTTETQSNVIPANPKVENVKPKIPKMVTKSSKQNRRKSNAKQNRNKDDEDKEDRKLKNIKVTSETLAANRRKRAAADTLYYWSSSSEDESQDLIEVKPIRDEIEEDDDRPIHHGWIVGDSPKKLVTMLAQAKGKKVDAESVKEQSKKRTTL